MSDYAKLREAKMARNAAILASLGLGPTSNALKITDKPEQPRRKYKKRKWVHERSSPRIASRNPSLSRSSIVTDDSTSSSMITIPKKIIDKLSYLKETNQVGATIYQCSTCFNVIGDSTREQDVPLQFSSPSIVLSFAQNVKLDDTVYTFVDRAQIEFGSRYHALKCNCDKTIGKVFLSTNSKLDCVVDMPVLDKNELATFVTRYLNFDKPSHAQPNSMKHGAEVTQKLKCLINTEKMSEIAAEMAEVSRRTKDRIDSATRLMYSIVGKHGSATKRGSSNKVRKINNKKTKNTSRNDPSSTTSNSSSPNEATILKTNNTKHNATDVQHANQQQDQDQDGDNLSQFQVQLFSAVSRQSDAKLTNVSITTHSVVSPTLTQDLLDENGGFSDPEKAEWLTGDSIANTTSQTSSIDALQLSESKTLIDDVNNTKRLIVDIE